LGTRRPTSAAFPASGRHGKQKAIKAEWPSLVVECAFPDYAGKSGENSILRMNPARVGAGCSTVDGAD